jgi:hypothetical protein
LRLTFQRATNHDRRWFRNPESRVPKKSHPIFLP